MAANPLFQSYRKQETFNTKTVNNRSTGLLLPEVMAQPPPQEPYGGKRHLSLNVDKSQAKRPRIETKSNEPKPNVEESDDWDDSFEMTQQDLDTLDIMASQALGDPSTSAPSTSRQPASIKKTEQSSFGAETTFQTPAPGISVPSRLKDRSSTSGSSGSSVYPQSSASFRYFNKNFGILNSKSITETRKVWTI
jgi:hypothetical protein